jgi:hypothetical protein
MQLVFDFCHLIHFLAMIMGLGTLLAGAVAFSQFWKLYDENKATGIAAFKAFSKLQPMGMIGLLLLILSGVGMLWFYNWSFMSLLWFQIKLGLIVLMLISGFTYGRTTTLKLQTLLMEGANPKISAGEITALRNNLRRFQMIQISLIVLIIIMSTFRFL